MNIAWYFFTSLIVSAILSVLCYLILAYKQVLDIPNQRSSHNTPIVRGGGLGISLVILTYLFFDSWQIKYQALICTLISLMLISLIDDIRGLSAKLKLLVHILILIGFTLSLYQLNLKSFDNLTVALHVPEWILYLLSFIWLLSFTNIFNFMDGINGLAASQAIISGTAYLIICSLAGISKEPLIHLSVVIAGSCLGFLPFNFPRARVFLGDVGSIPLGFSIGFLVLMIPLTFGAEFLVPVLIVQVNFLLDTSITIMRRFWRRESIFKAHREHFYQRLVRAGKSHSFVTGMQMCLQSICVLLAALSVHSSLEKQMFFFIGAVFLWLTFFLYAEKAFIQYEKDYLNA